MSEDLKRRHCSQQLSNWAEPKNTTMTTKSGEKEIPPGPTFYNCFTGTTSDRKAIADVIPVVKHPSATTIAKVKKQQKSDPKKTFPFVTNAGDLSRIVCWPSFE